MTDQELFDKIKSHLLKQGRRSLNAEGKCAYRSADGAQCAVGCLIKDEHYDPSLEGQGVWSLEMKSILWQYGIVASQSLRLLNSLQELHDYNDPENWEAKLNEVAREFNLR